MTTRAELIEAMARALADAHDDQDYETNAEAALNAIGAVAAVVPRPMPLAAASFADGPVISLEGLRPLIDVMVAAADLTTAPVAERVMEDDGA